MQEIRAPANTVGGPPLTTRMNMPGSTDANIVKLLWDQHICAGMPWTCCLQFV